MADNMNVMRTCTFFRKFCSEDPSMWECSHLYRMYKKHTSKHISV